MDEDYTALENELAQTVANIESTHPGYDEYRYSVDEIGHNPYELASYLSAKYHVYFREQVQDELREIFEAQYELTLTEEVEIRKGCRYYKECKGKKKQCRKKFRALIVEPRPSGHRGPKS